MVSNHAEGTFGRLRYLLGGDRPSQTAHLTVSHNRITVMVRSQTQPGWYPKDGSAEPDGPASKPPTYPVQTKPKTNARLQ